jgi:hypothetical protein
VIVDSHFVKDLRPLPQKDVVRAFTPSPEEIAAIVLFHIGRVKKAVVAFDLGCGGEPLSAAPLGKPMGAGVLIQGIRSSCPRLEFGYVNPPQEKSKMNA